MKVVDTGHIIVDPEVLSGEPHIAGHRIGVSDIAIWVNVHAKTADEIAQEFHLSRGEVYAALSYYFDHKDEIDLAIAEADQQAMELAKQYPRGWKPDGDGSHHVS